MPSTYTTNTGIEKPGSGEQSGNWGTTVNINMDILDRAINGVGSISLSGTTSTLTTTDGSLSDGMYNVLILGGSPSGTHTITVAPADAQKVYTVLNSSGQTVIFTQGAGSATATVLNGDSAIIYADGSDECHNLTNGLGMNSVNIDGGSIDGTPVGAASASTGNFSTLSIAGTAITATAAELNKVDGFTGTADDLNYAKDLRATGVTSTEFDYLDGVTSAIQTQLNGKAALAGSASQAFSALSVTMGNWTITESSGLLTFAYSGTNRMKLDGAGNLTVTGNVTANGTV